MKANNIFSGLLTVSLFALISCQQAPPAVDLAAVTAEIQGLEDAFAAAEIKRDADGIVAYYTEDAISYVANQEPVVGKEAIRQRMAERMAKADDGNVPTFKVLEVFAGPEYVTEIGSWVNHDANGVEVDHGNYFSVFRKEEGKWRCIRDIAVSALPRKPDAPAEAAE
jgi:uncharacterized protein (TIGR02246 family)